MAKRGAGDGERGGFLGRGLKVGRKYGIIWGMNVREEILKAGAMLSVVLGVAFCSVAETVVDVTGVGAEKFTVAVNVSNAAYANSLKRNLERSGVFVVQANGAIRVSGTPGGAVKVEGRGKVLTSTAAVTDEKSARMAARRLSDAMCEAYAGQKGFACDQVAFVNRKGKNNSQLCVGYPDGYDVMQLTSDAAAVVGPRWKDANTLFYTFLKAGPQIYEYNLANKTRKLRWSFKGLTTGAAVSPDGKRVAIILSFQGNPELYVIEGDRYTRLTNTPNASEGQPAWSPDGKKIVYVSDESRHPHLYVVDVATKKTRRLTSKGSQNVDPDWGRDGRITYITKRAGGAQVAVMEPAEGESAARLVTGPGTWEHPSWSRDMRHVVAGRDKAIFIVDTLEGGDEPRQMFSANGNWITPSWSK